MAVFDNWPNIDLTAINFSEFLQKLADVEKQIAELKNAVQFKLEPATAQKLGGVYSGNEVSVDTDGQMHVIRADVANSVKWSGIIDKQFATDEKAGIIKLGAGLTMQEDGKVNVTSGGTADSVEWSGVLHKQDAGKAVKGIMQVGERLSVVDGVVSADLQEYNLKPASANTRGGIRVGANLYITDDDVLNATANPYKLKEATSEELGGVRIGDNVNVDADGKISVAAPLTAGDNVTISNNKISVAKPLSAGTNVTITDSKINASVPTATTTVIGGIKVDTQADKGYRIDSDALVMEWGSASKLGIVKVGSNITASNGVISVPKASASTYGVIKASVSGTTLTLTTT